MRNAPSDFTLTSAWVRSIDTTDLRSPRIDPFGWSDRFPTTPKTHIIILSSPRSLG